MFRIGGDEFSVVLLGEDLQNREELTRQLIQAQEDSYTSAQHPWEQISIAMGIAVYDPLLDPSVNGTLRRADQLMYENKRAKKAKRR